VITWNLGGGFSNGELFAQLMDVFRFFQPEHHRFAVFDAPPGCRWEGGRPFVEATDSDKKLSLIITCYNSQRFGFNFVFSNSLLGKEHLKDKRGNYFLERHHNPLNGVIVSSEILADHIRKNFPQYTLIYSLTHGRNKVTDLDFYRAAQEKYDIVVLVPDLNNELDFIRKLEPSKLEILINETCFFGCRYRQLHYRTIDWLNLHQEHSIHRDMHRFCCIHDADLLGMSDDEVRKLQGLKLRVDQIQQLMDLGVCNFKISGRLLSPKSNTLRADIVNLMFPFLKIPEIALRVQLSGRFGGPTNEAVSKQIKEVVQHVRKQQQR